MSDANVNERAVNRWLKEPLLHFFVAGALLFGAYAWLNPPAPDAEVRLRQVRIGAGEVKWVTETWVRQWGREPTPEELRALVTNLLKEELLAREAREMRLDENDTIVRRRLAQKLEFIVRDTARLVEPTEDELRRLYDAHPDRFLEPARVSFRQIYFNPARRKDAATDAVATLTGLSAAGAPDPDALGDRFLLDAEYAAVDRQAVAAAFGPGFAREVFALAPGAWHGPIASGYGLHLVAVASAQPARRRGFDEVRAQVLALWREERERESDARLFAGLLEKYDVVIDERVKPLVGPLGLARPPEAAER